MTQTSEAADRRAEADGPFSRERWRTRWRRALPPNLGPPVRAAVVVGYVLAGALCVLILTGWVGAEEATALGVPVRPLTHMVALVSVAGIGALLALAAARHSGWQRFGCGASATVLAAFCCGWLPHGTVRILLSIPLLMAVVVAVCWPLRGHGADWVRAAVVALPGMLAAAWQPFMGLGDRLLIALRAAGLTSQAAIGLSALAVYSAIASLSEHRRRASRLMAGPTGLNRVLVAIAVKLVVLVALFAGLTGEFLGGRGLWSPGFAHPLSWLHAAVVAAPIVLVALVAVDHPLIDSGVQPRLALIGLILGVSQVAALLAFLVTTVLGVVGLDALPVLSLVNLVIDASATVQWVAVGILGLAALLTLRGRTTPTAGWWLGTVAVLWLLPPLLGIAFESSTVFWATPARVDAMLFVVVCVLIGWRRIRDDPRRRRVLVALLVVPLVLHVENLLPDAWSGALIRVTFVLAAVNTLLLAAPPVRADRRVAERQRCLAVAGQLGILAAAYFVLQSADLSAGLATSAQLAWLWFAVPFMALLTMRYQPGTGEPRP